MKLILSRKGFDSGYGGMASPILPDGSLLSLPIPSDEDDFTLADLSAGDINMGQLITDLSRGQHALHTHIHLDPDLDRSPTSQLPGWRPSLGQTGNAQSHLEKQGISNGDVFLFFGWFRETENHRGVWRYVPGAPDIHVIFGWLEIGEVLPIARQRNACLENFPWIANHPHVAKPSHYSDERNTLYVAKTESSFSQTAKFGGGRFDLYNETLKLTRPGCTRTNWSLPHWFMPNDRTPLTYNPRPDQWQMAGDRVHLRSAAKGQEFVLDSAEYPELESWVASIIRENAK